jgi:Tol biopolymer transport system component
VSTDRDLTNFVRSWLHTDQHESADRVLSAVFDRLETTPQRRPLWRAWRSNLMNGTFKLVAAGTAAVLVAAIGLGIYLKQPNVGPTSSPPPGTAGDSPSPAQTIGPTTAAVRAPFVAFMLRDGQAGVGGDDLWAMRADGTGAQELQHAIGFTNVAWSQDGTKLLAVIENASGSSHVYLADVGDVIGPLVDTGFGTGADTACNAKSNEPAPCQDGDFTFSPDGQRVAFTQSCTYSVPGCGFITILDLRTGERTELSSTLQQGLHKAHPGGLAWSPDGTHIAFNQETKLGQDQDAIQGSNLWIVDADGRNRHKIVLSVPRVGAPQWSADGTMLALMSDLYVDGPTPGDQILVQDVYTVRPEGTGLRQLTTDGHSIWPQWTRSGQIRFRIGNVGGPTDTMRYVLMDADGSNVTELVDLESLITAIAPEGTRPTIPGDLGPAFLWQPGSTWYENR